MWKTKGAPEAKARKLWNDLEISESGLMNQSPAYARFSNPGETSGEGGPRGREGTQNLTKLSHKPEDDREDWGEETSAIGSMMRGGVEGYARTGGKGPKPWQDKLVANSGIAWGMKGQWKREGKEKQNK